MSKMRRLSLYRGRTRGSAFFITGNSLLPLRRQAGSGGGASRDRTDDLKLAKLALSQLSYGPEPLRGRGVCRFRRLRQLVWWAEKELNLRPHAYQACALTT